MTQPTRAQQLDSEFVQFLRDNPTVYPQFRLLAVKLKAKGIHRWGAKAIWEVLRYEIGVEVGDDWREVRPQQQLHQPVRSQADE